jgi:hypothetical protein
MPSCATTGKRRTRRWNPPAGRRATRSFAALAVDWRAGLHFEPVAVHVRSCDEQADTAVAHLVILGGDRTRQRFKDAVHLRRGPDGWSVALSPLFGRLRP